MSNIDLSKKWCIYRSEHPTGFYYQGKGITANVHSGKYKGSGYKFKLAVEHADQYAFDTWNTKVLATFDDEEDAYSAEAELIKWESLSDPFCLNITCGGRKSRGKDAGALYRSITKKKNALIKKQKAEKVKQKIADLKKLVKKQSKVVTK